jgi:hypothetical protein
MAKRTQLAAFLLLAGAVVNEVGATPSIKSDGDDIQFAVSDDGRVSVTRGGVSAGDVQTTTPASLTEAIKLGVELGKELGREAAEAKCSAAKVWASPGRVVLSPVVPSSTWVCPRRVPTIEPQEQM